MVKTKLDQVCPCCESYNYVKNGHSSSGKQNHICKDCSRQFVYNPTPNTIPEDKKIRIKEWLLERVPLIGICRVEKVSYNWLLDFAEKEYEMCPDDLNVILTNHDIEPQNIHYQVCEADELWSFVGKRKVENYVWIWLAIHVETRQVLSMYCGPRDTRSGEKLFLGLPEVIRENGIFYTDYCKIYGRIFDISRHVSVGKESGQTDIVEGFNCILRQRVSRLVRETLSFSRKLSNHIGAIKYFICHYNLSRRAYFI